MIVFFQWLGVLVAAALGTTLALFKKRYNEQMPSVELPIPTPPVPTSPATPSEPHTSVNPTLTQILTYMRDFEGKQGDANWRNNNPLNYRFYDPKQTGTDVEYLPMYKPVKCSSSGFAIFSAYSIGWLYAMNDKKNRIKNHPNWTLLDMITNHAPPSENDPLGYTQNVANRAKIDIHYPLKNLILV